MKHADEVKTKSTSLRMTETQHEIISSCATEKGMSLGEYMTYRSMQKEGLSPELLARIMNVVNIAIRIAKDTAPESVSMLDREVNALWSLLS